MLLQIQPHYRRLAAAQLILKLQQRRFLLFRAERAAKSTLILLHRPFRILRLAPSGRNPVKALHRAAALPIAPTMMTSKQTCHLLE